MESSSAGCFSAGCFSLQRRRQVDVPMAQRVFHNGPAAAPLQNLQRPTRKLHVSRRGDGVKVPRAAGVHQPLQHRPVQRLEPVLAAFEQQPTAREPIDGGEESEVLEVRLASETTLRLGRAG